MIQLFERIGRRLRSKSEFPSDFSPKDIDLFTSVRPFTMTTPERVFVLAEAVRYIVANNVPGDIMECGVWRGGSMMTVVKTLVELGNFDRHLYLFDTFEGMPEPGDQDIRFDGMTAAEKYHRLAKPDGGTTWASVSIDEVRSRLYGLGYKNENIHLVKGKVEETIPAFAPQQVSILRLDTDWYESTLHELVHLYPRLSPRGVLIIDDYGYWRGARQATDEYIRENRLPLLLNRIDFTGRIAVKA